MPLSPGYLDKVVAQLNAARPITSRKMFGGGGFYFDGVFFAIADDDKVFFKVDDQTVGAYESRGMGAWLMGGVVNNAYRKLPPELLDNPDELGDWIDGAVEVARRKAAGKAKKK